MINHDSVSKIAVRGSLMIQGTTSDAGKSILVAGICRVLKRRGIAVAPFKPQNMALNSAVTVDGGEIGRAQALQAVACGLEAHTDFNPVLLKPSSDCRSQVIIQGKVVSELDAEKFSSLKALAFDKVLQSYRKLQQQYDVIIIEGAGSPAEINLRENDIANMGFAEAVNCPVLLISDIDRGGVFAHLTGTLNLLSIHEQHLVKGFVINKFRGELGLLQGGLDWLKNETNKDVFAVLPFIKNLKLDAEDAISRDNNHSKNAINIVVIVLPRISNHTDFEPLAANAEVNLRYVYDAKEFSPSDLIIIPGSKNVIDDLIFLKNSGWDQIIFKHLRYGGKLVGICGGFQMLGQSISDPLKIESVNEQQEGLRLLDHATILSSDKVLKQVSGNFLFAGFKGYIEGYEIHCGETQGESLKNPFCEISDQQGNEYFDGAVSQDEQIIGSYVHGLFEQQAVIEGILSWVSGKNIKAENWNDVREQQLERLADTLEENFDLEQLFSIIE